MYKSSSNSAEISIDPVEQSNQPVNDSISPQYALPSSQFIHSLTILLASIMSGELFIPPAGIYFRILGDVSQYCAFSRNSPSPEVFHAPMNKSDDAQLFSLLHGTGDHAGKYAIKGKASGKVLFSRHTSNPQVGHIAGDGAYQDK